jgi:hypothetical protein
VERHIKPDCRDICAGSEESGELALGCLRKLLAFAAIAWAGLR